MIDLKKRECQMQFLKNDYVKFALLFIGILLMAGACSQVNKMLGLKDDNVLEEIMEEIIEQKAGIDIDLTP